MRSPDGDKKHQKELSLFPVTISDLSGAINLLWIDNDILALQQQLYLLYFSFNAWAIHISLLDATVIYREGQVAFTQKGFNL